MNNNLQEMVELVILKSQEIHCYLSGFKAMTVITEKMEERNALLAVLIEKALAEGRRDIFSQLLIVKKEEEKVLEPYREEFKALKEQLIKLNQTQEYLSD